MLCDKSMHTGNWDLFGTSLNVFLVLVLVWVDSG